MGWSSPAILLRPGHVERPPRPGLAHLVDRVWISAMGEDQPTVRRVIPDGSADIIWMGDTLRVAGPDTRAALVRLGPGAIAAGVRFHPGRAPALLGVPADALRDQRVDLELLWGRSATESLSERAHTAADTPDALPDLLETVIDERLDLVEPPDPLIAGLVTRLREADPPVRVGDLAWDLGLSTRQLLRRCEKAVGYGPIMLGRVLRLQRFLALAARDSTSLAELAATAGYADQPHLTRDSRELTGLTPAALLAERGLRPRSPAPDIAVAFHSAPVLE